MTDRTLVILNPNASNGEARAVLDALAPALALHFGELLPQETPTVAAVPAVVAAAYADGVRRVLAVGGDGTNHSVVSAVLAVQDAHPDNPPMVYGIIPVGTGRDFCRMLGMPLETRAAAAWLTAATPQPTDVGVFLCDDAPPEAFLNIGSIGLGGCVGERVNGLARRYPWTFMLAAVRCILAAGTQRVTITADEVTVFDGETFIAVAANGAIFGHGMQIAPAAAIDDGLLDLVAVADVTRVDLLGLFAQVYRGTHLTHRKVTHHRARSLTMTSHSGEAIPLELDGESRYGARLTFRVRPGALQMLR